jgi:hypothetical protein
MNTIEKAYASGMTEIFNSNGMSKKASYRTAKLITKLQKKASLFNFGDSQGGGFSLSSILIPLLAAGATGYVAYNAGLQGSKRRSAFSNIKNYIGRSLSNVVRNDKAPTLVSPSAYF